MAKSFNSSSADLLMASISQSTTLNQLAVTSMEVLKLPTNSTDFQKINDMLLEQTVNTLAAVNNLVEANQAVIALKSIISNCNSSQSVSPSIVTTI